MWEECGVWNGGDHYEDQVGLALAVSLLPLTLNARISDVSCQDMLNRDFTLRDKYDLTL